MKICANLPCFALTAHELAQRLLEGDDFKGFLRAMGRERAAQAYAAAVHPGPCTEWPEWVDLEEWQRTAARELETEQQAELELDRHDAEKFEVSTPSASFAIYQDEGTAEAAAIAQVEDQLESEPENFNQDWLATHLDTEHLRDQLYSDVADMIRENEEDSYGSMEDRRDHLIDQDKLDRDPFFDADGNALELNDKLENAIDAAWESYLEQQANSQLEDPLQYLQDIYGEADALKQAMIISRIDTRAAAEEAVSTDGLGHFLSSYDGNYDTLPSGAVVVRTN